MEANIQCHGLQTIHIPATGFRQSPGQNHAGAGSAGMTQWVQSIAKIVFIVAE
jgi:hypothetical protein